MAGLSFALATLAQPVKATSETPSALEASWRAYRAAIEQSRQAMLNSEFARDPLVRSQGYYFLHSLETVAFGMYISPRQEYPTFYTQSIISPFELSWRQPSPDFLYRHAFVDGARTYRISGNARGNFWTTLQVLRGQWGDAEQGELSGIDFDQVPRDANGNFEIFLGPNPPSDREGAVWIETDPALPNMTIRVREVFYDWRRDAVMDIRIDALDRPAGTSFNLTEDELAERIDKARKWASHIFAATLAELEAASLPANPGRPSRLRNVFSPSGGAVAQGGHPAACYATMLYDVRPDEALVIDMPVVPARYWGMQLSDLWQQTTEYSYHQSSLNGAQARLDADGHVRAVLALTDPGVPNWLDPAGISTGHVVLRSYRADECVTPAVTKIKLAELRRHLPARTPTVSPAERQAALQARQAASLLRYGR